ncbi:hypothetical protein [Pseudooceanicola aestuarii]|uniref:hypothetical protein n=1 Tax=Pseudooceanicola aestuarii TaxID=2697319 RepID=UPI0019530940|nr:hypothetical protein [Pseudooceanicola aestuarii]
MRLILVSPLSRKVLAGIGGGVGFFANLAEVVALAGAVWAFVHPGDVARMAVGFEQHLIAARQDLGLIAEKAEQIEDNTGRTADNTRRLADAIPYWLVFETPPTYRLLPSAAGPYRYSFVLQNPSVFPIDLEVEVRSDGKVVARDTLMVMPLEDEGVNWSAKDQSEQITICLTGTSDALDGPFYEQRIYGDDVSLARGFAPIPGC